ncbi:MAG: hypothetical protein WBK77_02820 [Alphaproteobacteria bacterium]
MPIFPPNPDFKAGDLDANEKSFSNISRNQLANLYNAGGYVAAGSPSEFEVDESGVSYYSEIPEKQVVFSEDFWQHFDRK